MSQESLAARSYVRQTGRGNIIRGKPKKSSAHQPLWRESRKSLRSIHLVNKSTKTLGGDSSFHRLQTETSQSDQNIVDVRAQTVSKKDTISNRTRQRTSVGNSNVDCRDHFSNKVSTSQNKETKLSKKILTSTILLGKGDFKKLQTFAPEYTGSPISFMKSSPHDFIVPSLLIKRRDRQETRESKLGSSVRNEDKDKLSKTQKSQKNIFTKIEGRKTMVTRSDRSSSACKSELYHGSFFGELFNMGNIEVTYNEIAPSRENSYQIGERPDKTVESNIAHSNQNTTERREYLLTYADKELCSRKYSKEQNTPGECSEAMSDTNDNQVDCLPNEYEGHRVLVNRSVGIGIYPRDSESNEVIEYDSHIVATAKRNNCKRVNNVTRMQTGLSEATSAQSRRKYVRQDFSIDDLDVNESVSNAKHKKNEEAGSETSGSETHMKESHADVRRSARKRIHPLAVWRNERLKYCFSNDGNLTLVGIDSGSTDYTLAGKRRATTANLGGDKQKALKGKQTLAKYCRVLDSSKNEVNAHIVKPFESVSWIPGARKGSETTDYRITETFEKMGCGFIEIEISKEKGMQFLPETDIQFCVFRGKVEVTVNKSTFSANELTSFLVPRGNPYKLVNIGNKKALISFSLCDPPVL